MYKRVSHNFNKLDSKIKLSAVEQKYYDTLFCARASAQQVIKEIDGAKGVFRSKRNFYDISKLSESQRIINLAHILVSAAYYPTKLSFSSFEMKYSHESSSDVIKATLDRVENPFIDIYKDDLIPYIFQENPDIVGISIIGISQLIPGLTLARLLKSSNCRAHVVVGGSIFTRLIDILPQRKNLFSMFFDSVIAYEGERPLLELAKCLANGKSLKTVPNLIYYDGTKVCVNETCSPENINSLPTPCFDGFPLNLYFSPEPILPLMSSRGCYWRKCAFCDHSHIYGNRYVPQNSERVVDNLEELSKKYGTSYFSFSDEAIAPNVFKSLSEKIIERKLNIQCLADARFERQFTSALCRKIANAGFKMLLFGLESGCDRVLTLMKKGTDRQTISELCKNSSHAGIWNHVFLFFGFPTETEEEAQETIDFVLSNKDIIHSVGCSVFSLGKYSPIRKHPEVYGVSSIQIDGNKDFQLWYNYDVNTGLNQEKAREVYKAFQELIADKYDNFKVWGKLHRDHLLLYLSRYGTNNLSLISKEIFNRDKPITSTQEGRWSDKVPRLNDGVTYNTVHFDLLEIQENIKREVDTEVLPKETYIVYDFNEGKMISITSSAKDILELCDGKANVHQIASKIAKSYSISVNNAEAGCINFLKDLVSRGFVLV
ncbi:MAG: PqqD family peptide modification chaperone [Candidatus Aminicenantes bacterium]|nr:PqqD family peptide modification chaperone [Candidatus Aminicenantes bacterium]